MDKCSNRLPEFEQCWFTADLYVEQILTGVFAVKQACCQAVLQSSTEQRGMHFTLTSVQ